MKMHGSYLDDTVRLSAMQVKTMIPPIDVITVLNRAGVRFVLVGAHGIAEWLKKPRATQDVDVVVMNRHLKKAQAALLDAFPNLRARDEEIVIRFRDAETDVVLIDVIKQRELYRASFRHVVQIDNGDESLLIPTVEMAIVMKFASMTSANRPTPAKYQDAHDFSQMIEQNEEVNQKALRDLGDLLYGGGGDAVLEAIRKVRADETLDL